MLHLPACYRYFAHHRDSGSEHGSPFDLGADAVGAEDTAGMEGDVDSWNSHGSCLTNHEIRDYGDVFGRFRLL